MFIFEELLEIDAEADMREVWKRLSPGNIAAQKHAWAGYEVGWPWSRFVVADDDPIALTRYTSYSAMQGCKQ